MRSIADYAALAARERNQDEPAGATVRAFAKDFGVELPETAADPLPTLAEVARLLSVPAAVQKRLTDLQKASDVANKAAAEAKAQQAAAAQQLAEARKQIKAEQDAAALRIGSAEADFVLWKKQTEAALAAKAKELDTRAAQIDREEGTIKQRARVLREQLDQARL
jgi:hypothetical protein